VVFYDYRPVYSTVTVLENFPCCWNLQADSDLTVIQFCGGPVPVFCVDDGGDTIPLLISSEYSTSDHPSELLLLGDYGPLFLVIVAVIVDYIIIAVVIYRSWHCRLFDYHCSWYVASIRCCEPVDWPSLRCRLLGVRYSAVITCCCVVCWPILPSILLFDWWRAVGELFCNCWSVVIPYSSLFGTDDYLVIHSVPSTLVFGWSIAALIPIGWSAGTAILYYIVMEGSVITMESFAGECGVTLGSTLPHLVILLIIRLCGDCSIPSYGGWFVTIVRGGRLPAIIVVDCIINFGELRFCCCYWWWWCVCYPLFVNSWFAHSIWNFVLLFCCCYFVIAVEFVLGGVVAFVVVVMVAVRLPDTTVLWFDHSCWWWILLFVLMVIVLQNWFVRCPGRWRNSILLVTPFGDTLPIPLLLTRCYSLPVVWVMQYRLLRYSTFIRSVTV